MRRKEPGIALVETIGDETLGIARGQVLVVSSDLDYERLTAAVAGAAAVALITEGTAQNVRAWLDLDTSAGYRVPIMVVMVTDEPVPNVPLLAATAGVTAMRNIRPAAHGKAIKQLRRMGRSLARYAIQPRRSPRPTRPRTGREPASKPRSYWTAF